MIVTANKTHVNARVNSDSFNEAAYIRAEEQQTYTLNEKLTANPVVAYQVNEKLLTRKHESADSGALAP